MNKYSLFLIPVFLVLIRVPVFSQDQPERVMGLDELLRYALKNQPAILQSRIDEEIAETDIKIALSGWLPQVSGQGNLSRFLKQPVSILNGQPVIFQPKNSSNFLLQADQSIFNNDLLFASKGAKYTRLSSQQSTVSNKINTVVSVSKAYYDILTSQEQLRILQENIARVEKQFKDSYAQYDAGLVDKTDYKRAAISLNNSKADLKRISESLNSKFAYLKQLLGYPEEQELRLETMNAIPEAEILLDTSRNIRYENRIEYQQILTQKQIQSLNIDYYKNDFLPDVSAFVNYNNVYQNNEFGSLFKENYPSSQAGLRLSIPIFTGGRRLHNLRRAVLQDKRIDLDLLQARNVINTEFEEALASYKSNLNDWRAYSENAELSLDVYNTIKLQYNEGIKTYLDLLIAESDLRTSQLNYLNSLFNVLSSKLDVQRAQGTISLND